MNWAAEQAAALNELADAFGAVAEWRPSSGAIPYVVPVLFDAASQEFTIDAPGAFDLGFDADNYLITIPADAFPGLRSSVEDGNVEEIHIEIDGVPRGCFCARKVRAVGDGGLHQVLLSEA